MIAPAIVRAIALGGLLLITARLHAAPAEAVVVVSEDSGFTRAVEDAFRAAGIRAVQAESVAAPAIADLTSVSRRLADREHAAGAVVLISGEDGATLIAYDRGGDRALVRVLPYRTPLDPRESAEAAHMARTMLRTLRAPPEEAQEIDPDPARSAEAMPVDAPVSMPRAIAQDRAAPPGVIALAPIGGLRVGVAGARGGASGALQLIWRPDALGLAVTVAVSRAASVDAPSFTGSVSDTVGALTARLALARTPRWQLIGEAGLAVHRVRLAGMSAGPPTGPAGPRADPPAGPPAGPAVEIARFDPAIRLGGAAMLTASPGISAGLTAWVDGLLVRQDVRFATRQILDVPVAQLTVGAIVVVRIL